MAAAVDQDRAAPVVKVAGQADALPAGPAPVERAARRPSAMGATMKVAAAVALAVSGGVAHQMFRFAQHDKTFLCSKS